MQLIEEKKSLKQIKEELAKEVTTADSFSKK
jgi:hypothetical protein